MGFSANARIPPVLRVDPSRLSGAYRRAPLAARHGVADGGPLAAPAIAALVRGAAPGDVERTGTALGPGAGSVGSADAAGAARLLTVHGVERRGAPYAAILEGVVADLRRMLPGELADARATLDVHVGGPFVLGPSRVSGRHRLVLQVRGTLELHVGAPEGLRLVHAGDGGRPERERIFPLTAGHAAYVPAGRRAWTVVGPEGALVATVSWGTPSRGEWRRRAGRRGSAPTAAPIPVSGPGLGSARGRVCRPVRSRHA